MSKAEIWIDEHASADDIHTSTDDYCYTREFVILAFNYGRKLQREEDADIAKRIAEMMESGAGETEPGERLRQVERMIREQEIEVTKCE